MVELPMTITKPVKITVDRTDPPQSNVSARRTPLICRWLGLVIAASLALPCSANIDSATLAFGSCLRQWQPQPVWAGVRSTNPDAFLFLGDNVYTDVGRYAKLAEPARIGLAYTTLIEASEFASFRQWADERDVPIFATWDDHDYGVNNGGREYPYRVQSKHYFQETFRAGKWIQSAGIGPDDAGIYHAVKLNLAGVRVQLIMLDVRSFRTELVYGETTASCTQPILPATDPAADMLGEQQWRWLAEQLREPADLRLLASGIQVLPTEHCYEKWANFPLQRERLLDLIRDSGARGVLLVSGDRHLAEISALPATRVGYPLYEITSSGLNSAAGKSGNFRQETNRLRYFDENVTVDNFGSIEIRPTADGNNQRTELLLRLHDHTGKVRQRLPVLLDTMTAVPSPPANKPTDP